MAKTAALSVRIDPALKSALEKHAVKDGRTLASYVERVLALHHQPPAWLLRDAQPIHRKPGGPRVSLSVAEGWPAAIVSVSTAKALGEQLIRAAQLAEKLPPAE
jgi:hypothetical protein